MTELRFLTDEEYEAVRRDMATILQSIDKAIEEGEGVSFDYYGKPIGVTLEDIAAKLTAYVDQKVKKYY